MDTFLHACIAGVNDLGRGFCSHAAGVFVQSGVLIVVLLSADLALRSRVRATLRYWIWMLVIIKLLLPPTFSLPTGVGHWVGGYVALPASVERQVLETAGPRETPGQVVSPAAPVPPSNAGVETALTTPIESLAMPAEHLTWQGGVVLLWGAGILGFAGWVSRRVFFVRRLMARGQTVKGDLVDLLDECRRRMNIHRQVRMKLLPGAFSPAVCGLWQPTILLPQTLPARLAPENLRAVLIHELAHIKRADLWVNCVQTILQVIYFYNPLVWLANAIVRRVREQAVDEMSLVALGAEARSYGNTLIDIAEMAFWRASPALRLIGVAESKKSLEGRIRHMLLRPIPTSARVGVIGAVIIVVLGAVLLPMATAQTRTAAPRLTANLSHGVSVELVGVCNWPTPEPICWKADGSPLDQPLRVTKWNQRPGAKHYGFMLKITGPKDDSFSWQRIEGTVGFEGSCDVVDAQGNRLEDYTAAIAQFREVPAQTTVEVGLAAGPWSTISSHAVKERMQTGHSGVLWSQAFEYRDGTSIVASTEWNRSRAERIVAVDTRGVEHTTRNGGSVASGGVEQFTAHFDGLKPEQIREFQYQVRPYQQVKFENISLRPGVETKPQVQTLSQSSTVGSRESEDSRAGAAQSAAGKGYESRPNIFILSPSQSGFDVFGQVTAKAEDWTWNKTGRNHAKKSYDEIFDGTHNRTSHDILVLVFTLEGNERIPADYENLLPQPWAQIEEQLRQGQVVELSGRTRDLTVILFAAPRAEQLKEAIGSSRFLSNPQALLGRSGKGCDIALESFRVRPGHIPGAYRATVSGQNRGEATCPAFVVRFRTGDPAIDARTSGAGPLQPRETWDAGSPEFLLKEGVQDVGVVLDPANLVDELDETNNRAALRVVVKNGQIVEQSALPIGG